MIKLGFTWSLIIWLLMIVISALAVFTLPEGARLAFHWSVDGTPGNYTNKWFAAIALPLIAAFQIGFLMLIPNIPGQREQIERSAQFYLTGWISSVAALGFIHTTILANAMLGLDASIWPVLGFGSLLLLLLGNIMIRSRQNSWAGVRTPWTLRSQRSWSVANRTAGAGLVATALLTLILIVIAQDVWALRAYFMGHILSLLLSLVLSYQAAPKSRHDSEDSMSNGH